MAAKELTALGVLYSDRRVFYPQPQVVRELWPSVRPFLTVAQNFSQLQTPDPDYKMFEHRSGFVDAGFTINGTHNWGSSGAPKATATTVSVTGIVGLDSTVGDSWKGLMFEIWNSDYSEYKGYVRVAAASSTLTLTAIGNPRRSDNACQNMVAGDKAKLAGQTWATGKTAPDAWSDELEVVYNSCGITRTSVEVTGTLYAAALRGYSNELARLRTEKMKHHEFIRELMALTSVRIGGTGMSHMDTAAALSDDSFQNHDTDTETPGIIRTTMGIIPAIYRYGSAEESNDKQNIFNINPATYTWDNYVLHSEKAFQYIPDTGFKYGFAGTGFSAWLSMVGRGNSMIGNSGMTVNIDMMPTQGEFGLTYQTLRTPGGTIRVIRTPALRGPYKHSMLVIDPADLHHVTYRPQAFYTNIKTDNRYDGVKDEWFSDDGIGVTLIEKHSIWNLTTPPVPAPAV